MTQNDERSRSTDWETTLKRIATTFMRGLTVVLPVVLTIWLLVWLATGAESLMRNAFVFLFPSASYFTGLGILSGLILVYLAGLLLQLFPVRKLWEWFEALLERIPIVKTVYNAINDFFGFFSSNISSETSTVASIDMGNGARLLGFITDDRLDMGGIGSDLIAVYLPMSYQIGGYTVLAPRDRVDILDIPTEEALRFVLTAGIQRRKSSSQRT